MAVNLDSSGEEADAGNVVLSYPDYQASTFAVDSTGKRAVLAVQKWLAVVSLEQTEGEPKALRKLARQNKYEIKAVLWNPHMAMHQLMVSTCQQKLEIWNVDAERHPLLQSLKAHTRPVCDMSWSFSDPHLLSSCSTDTFIHIWDIREARKPKISFKAVAGATLVQWNRVNGNLIASAHDSDIRIWDKRKPSTASGYITAHMSRIHDIDWCYYDENQLTTCSHDGSVKFWDIKSPREPFNTIKVGAQKLWRAKNYPAGKAVALLLVPAMHSGDSRVFLWGQSNVSTPVHIFSGHSEAVLDLQWLNSERLATWSKDRTLRLWGIGKQLRSSLGGDMLDLSGVSIEDSLQISTEPSIELSLEDDSLEASVSHRGKGIADPSMSLPILKTSAEHHSPQSHGSPSTRSLMSLSQVETGTSVSPVFQSLGTQSLAQEFAELRAEGISNVEIERMEVTQRNCTVKVVQGGQLVRVGITFPSHYPNGAAPSFMFHQSTSISLTSQQELNRNIFDVASSHAKQNKPCLVACLRRLVETLESFMTRPQLTKQEQDFDLFGRLDDEHIPFPRSSGAHFSACGMFVCFSTSRLASGENTKTPRSLDKMNTFKSLLPVVRGSSHWPAHNYLSPSVTKRSSPGTHSGSQGRGGDNVGMRGASLAEPVTVYDAVSILPIDPMLARMYSVSGSDINDICSKNAAIASQFGRTDLIQAWSTAALIAEMGLHPPMTAATMPWPRHPFGRNLIKSLFSHFSRLHDVQMLAMLACVFQQHYNQSLENQRKDRQLLDQQQQTYASSPPSTPAASPHPGPVHQALHTTVSSHHPAASAHQSSHTAAVSHLAPHIAGSTQGSAHQTPHTAKLNPSPPKKVQGQQQVASPPSPISSSWHNVQLDSNGNGEQHFMEMEEQHDQQCRLLDTVMLRQCSEYHRSYADILYSWQLLDQRAEILKFQVTRTLDTIQQQIGFANLCKVCGAKVQGPACKTSHCFAFNCSICNLSVKGSSSFCLLCGHGGHGKHMLEWFSKYSHCPTGCGCCCLEASGWS